MSETQKKTKAPISLKLQLGLIVSLFYLVIVAAGMYIIYYSSTTTYLTAKNDMISRDLNIITGNYINENVISVLVNNLYGFVDYEGNYIQKPQYSAVYAYDVYGQALCQFGSEWRLTDAFGRRVLEEITKKSTKEDVTRLQQALADQGYYTGKINGKFDNNVIKAVKAAQKDFGMEADGVVSSDFQHRLFGN